MEESFSQIGYTLRFASGNAEEVLNWVTNGLVDIAVLSPGALVATGAVLRSEERNQRMRDGTYPAWDARYLITPELLPSRSPFADSSRRQDGGYTYESLVLVNRLSWERLKAAFPGTDEQTLLAANRQNRLQFVFGDPLSLSGTIVPRAQLGALGAEIGSRWEFSFGHKATIDLLLDEPTVTIGNERRERIGFIFDGSVPGSPPRLTGAEATGFATNRLALMEQQLVRVNVRRPPEPRQIILPTAQSKDTVTVPPALSALGSSMTALNDLPAEVWVVRPDFGVSETEELRNKLLGIRDSTTGRAVFADHNAEPKRPNTVDLTAARVRLWAETAQIDLGRSESGRAIHFSEIIHSMRHFERRFGTSARLALVLSGGGAKCAYQAGVIEEIEAEIRRMKDYQLHSSDTTAALGRAGVSPDISLVVGTSGGALNALPVAVGITASPGGSPTMLANLWLSTDLVRILDPYVTTSAATGMVFALVLWFAVRLVVAIACSPLPRQALAWIVARARKGNAAGTVAVQPMAQSRQWKILVAAGSVGALAIVAYQLVRTFLPNIVTAATPASPVVYYLFWLPLNVGAGWTAAWLVLIVLVTKRRSNARHGLPRFASWMDQTVYVAGVALLFSLALLLSSMFAGASLVKGNAVRQVVVNSIRAALGNHVPPNRCTGCAQEQQESALSAAIASDNVKRRRDLVITVTMLNGGANSDRYVYLPANARGPAPSYEQRALSLHRSSYLTFLNGPTNLLPFLIASGSVFPIFPPRQFQDPLGMQRTVKVVDGGFAHNSPVEAALDWGATHIVVVEASPSVRLDEQPSFASNLSVAFDHLFEQAQKTDHRSRDRVEIYYIRPRRELLKTMDFVPALMQNAIDEGKKDVQAGRFVQFSRPPVLAPVQ